MLATIHPGPIGGAVTVPPSKSIAHRTVLAAGLAKGLSRVYNLDPSQDIAATLAAVRAFGAKVKLTETYADIEGRGGFATILRPVDCGESGSTDKYIPYTDFTSPVGLSVITGKTLYHHACKFVFFTHENSLVGDEYIVKYHKSFMSTEL